jgi:hypothetical protein
MIPHRQAGRIPTAAENIRLNLFISPKLSRSSASALHCADDPQPCGTGHEAITGGGGGGGTTFFFWYCFFKQF